MSDETGFVIRDAQQDDETAILGVAQATGLFQAEELEQFNGMLSAYFSGDPESEHRWIVADQDNIVGAAYYAPEMMSDGVWNLYFIGLNPDHQGKGLGSKILAHVESDVGRQRARLLLIETSGVDSFDRTRAFYRNNGYNEEARIRDYYGSGNDKVIFRKALNAAPL